MGDNVMKEAHIGQAVGFNNKGTKYIGTVIELFEENGEELAIVDTPDVELIVPISKLLGVVRNEQQSTLLDNGA